jgi:hypothetical protein
MVRIPWAVLRGDRDSLQRFADAVIQDAAGCCDTRGCRSRFIS